MAETMDQTPPAESSSEVGNATSELLAAFVMQLGIEQSIMNAIVVNLASRSLLGSNLVAALQGTTPPGLEGNMRDKYGELLKARLDALGTLIERYRRDENATAQLNG